MSPPLTMWGLSDSVKTERRHCIVGGSLDKTVVWQEALDKAEVDQGMAIVSRPLEGWDRFVFWPQAKPSHAYTSVCWWT